MKNIKYILFLLLWLSCETEPDDGTMITNPPPPDESFETVGVYEMNYGPTDLAMKNQYAFVCRDDEIHVLDVSDVENPFLLTTIDDIEENNDFRQLLVHENILYAACSSTSGVYVIDITDPLSSEVKHKYLDPVFGGNELRAFSLFFENNTLWAGGSNGQNAFLVKYSTTSSDELSLEDYWVSNESANAIEGLSATGNHVFASTANGFIYALAKNDISAGPIGEYTFTNEAGHEHWGRAILTQGNRLYWADWGAGLATIDITDPSDMTTISIITHSSYTAEHPNAEGTNVYDLVLDATDNKIYAANGWSGLLKIDTNNPGQVEDYLDLQDNLYRCIALYGDYVLVGDNAAGTTDVNGVKIIKVK